MVSGADHRPGGSDVQGGAADPDGLACNGWRTAPHASAGRAAPPGGRSGFCPATGHQGRTSVGQPDSELCRQGRGSPGSAARIPRGGSAKERRKLRSCSLNARSCWRRTEQQAQKPTSAVTGAGAERGPRATGHVMAGAAPGLLDTDQRAGCRQRPSSLASLKPPLSAVSVGRRRGPSAACMKGAPHPILPRETQVVSR